MKSRSANISMTPEERQRAMIAAAEDGFSTLSGFVRKVLHDYLKARSKELHDVGEALEHSGRGDLAPAAERKRKAARTKAAPGARAPKAKKANQKKPC
jgi:hypothetical protein